MLDPAAAFRRSPELIATEVDGEFVLISLDGGQYFGLDQVASEIWRRLDTPKRVDALCAELQAHFEGDATEIEREAKAFLVDLAERKLVEPA